MPVTPDAATKEQFVIVDAIGVTEHDYVDAAPLQQDRSVSLERLFEKAANLTITQDEVATLAARLARLDRHLTDDERAEIARVAGQPLPQITRQLVRAVDPDVQSEAVGFASSRRVRRRRSAPGCWPASPTRSRSPGATTKHVRPVRKPWRSPVSLAPSVNFRAR
jgi:type I restriction enzyme R subunit